VELLLTASWFITGGAVLLCVLVILSLHWEDEEVDGLFEEKPLQKSRRGTKLK